MSNLTGFTFRNIHSSTFNITALSEGKTYKKPLFANFEDDINTVNGMNGIYYNGTNYKVKTRLVHCYIDKIDENDWRDIQEWLSPTNIGKLTFDEAPYKYYFAKVTEIPEFDYRPNRYGLYSGYITIAFTAFQPFAYSYHNSLDEFTYDNESWYYDSGILYAEDTPIPIIENITSSQTIYLYNGGNQRTKPIVKIEGEWDELTIKNMTTNQLFKLKAMGNVKIEVDSQKGQVRMNNTLASSYHEGGYIELQGTGRVKNYNGEPFTNGSNAVELIKSIYEDSIGRFIKTSDGFYKIENVDTELNKITLDRPYEGDTGVDNFIIMDLNEILITGVDLNISKIEFDYKYCYL